MVFNWGRNRNGDASAASTAVNSMDVPRDATTRAPVKDMGGPIPVVTFRTIIMTLLVALGGFIFGYDTGQISGFLEMDVFLERFGQRTSDLQAHPSGYYFTNVRSGLIVALVCESLLVRQDLANVEIDSCQLVL
jgi:hypothetical protein